MNWITIAIAFVEGKKTYLVAFGAIVSALYGWHTGVLSGTQAIEAIFAAVAVATTRRAITTEGQKTVAVIATLANPGTPTPVLASAIQTAAIIAPTPADVAAAPLDVAPVVVSQPRMSAPPKRPLRNK